MSMPLRVIRTEAAPAPVAGAPYSQAIAADRRARLSSCPARCRWTRPPAVWSPTTSPFRPARHSPTSTAVLAAAGATLANVVKSTVYLADLAGDFAAMNAVYAEAFGEHAPARSTVGVAGAAAGGARGDRGGGTRRAPRSVRRSR